MKVKIAILFCWLLVSCSSTKEEKNRSTEKVETLAKYRKEQQSLQEKISTLERELSDEKLLNERKVLVSTLSPERKVFSHALVLRGDVQSDHVVEIAPEVAGKIVSILVKEGDNVRKEQLLVQLNDEVIRNSLQEARVAWEHATTLYKRQKNLWADNIGTEYQYLEAKNRMMVLKGRMATLESQRKQTQIRAPFAGEVDELFNKKGAFVSPNNPLLRLINLEDFHVYAEVSDAHIGKIHTQDPVRVTLGTGEMIESKVSFVSKVLDANNRSFVIRVNLPSSMAAKINQVATLMVKDYIHEDALVVPSYLVRKDNKGHYLYEVVATKDKKMASKLYVEIGEQYKGETEVLAELSEESILIDKGYRSVFDKTSIDITEE